MDAFPIVKRKDEATHGTYRTKDTILEIYDALQDSIRTGTPYQTRLEPRPACFIVAHAPRLPESVRVSIQSPEKFLLCFFHSFFRQTGEESSFRLLDAVFGLLRQRSSHAVEFIDALGDDASEWLAGFNDTLPNGEYLSFLRRLAADGWIAADHNTGRLRMTEKFPVLPSDEWRNYDVSASLRVIARRPDVAEAILTQSDTVLASGDLQLQKAG